MADLTTVVLMRASLAEDEELEVAKRYFPVVETRSAIPTNSMVVGRYSVLPYYQELVNDLEYNGSRLINSAAAHAWVADMKNWYDELSEFTPKTWFSLAEFYRRKEVCSQISSFVLKGHTNSKKQQWDSHMFAATQNDVSTVYSRLSDDSFIGNQDIYIREYIPLRQFEVGIRGLPVTEEYRFFVMNGKIIASGYYWSQFPEVQEAHNLDPDCVPIKWLGEVIERASPHIPFLVCDVARTAAGKWIVMELNDGCMSGLSGCDPEQLYSCMRHAL